MKKKEDYSRMKLAMNFLTDSSIAVRSIIIDSVTHHHDISLDY